MKRNFVRTLLALLVCMGLLFCMIGCGDNENKGSETGTPTGEQQTQVPNNQNPQPPNQNGDEQVTGDGFSKNY